MWYEVVVGYHKVKIPASGWPDWKKKSWEITSRICHRDGIQTSDIRQKERQNTTFTSRDVTGTKKPQSQKPIPPLGYLPNTRRTRQFRWITCANSSTATFIFSTALQLNTPDRVQFTFHLHRAVNSNGNYTYHRLCFAHTLLDIISTKTDSSL